MKLPMLAVDNNAEVSPREQAEWQNQGIATVRVDSMQEAIEKLNKEDFLIVAINADNIHYLPLLRVIKDVTPILIFVITSNYTAKEHTAALDNGADVFGTFLGSLEENVLTALAMINRYGERSTMPKKPNRMMTYKGIALLPEISSSVLP